MYPPVSGQIGRGKVGDASRAFDDFVDFIDVALNSDRTVMWQSSISVLSLLSFRFYSGNDNATILFVDINHLLSLGGVDR